MPIVWEAVGATILPNLGGIYGSGLTKKNIPIWYNQLNKPSWTPPNAVFGPVWTALYSGMGFASYLVWRDGGGFQGKACLPLALYGTQLAINWAWTPIFFGCRNIKLGLVTIVALWGAVAASAVSMFQVNKTAGWIMVPYMAWLTLATALNYSLWKRNPDSGKVVPIDDKKK